MIKKHIVDSKKRLNITATKQGFIIRNGKKRQLVDFPQLFTLGYSLLNNGFPKAAEDAFEQLCRVRGRGARAKIMLARCKAELDMYDDCEKIINSIFDDNEAPGAEELQTAFVYHSLGMTKDAIAELVKVANQYPDLPTACLYLGDLFLEAGQLAKAEQCWKLAISRDRKGGAIGKLARKQIAQVREHAKKAKSKQKS